MKRHHDGIHKGIAPHKPKVSRPGKSKSKPVPANQVIMGETVLVTTGDDDAGTVLLGTSDSQEYFVEGQPGIVYKTCKSSITVVPFINLEHSILC